MENKKLTSMNIKVSTIEECKKRFINMSEVAQEALDKALNKQEINIDNSIVNCQFCGIEGEKETREDIEKLGHYSKPNKLTWLYPDEKWICNRCLRALINKEALNAVGSRK